MVESLEKGLIYLVIRIVWTFESHQLLSVVYIYTTDIINQHSISGNNTKQVLQSELNKLHYLVSDLLEGATGKNVAVGPGTYTTLTSCTNNVAIGSGAAGGIYSIQAVGM